MIQSQVVLFAPAARTADANSDDRKNSTGRGVALFLDITAKSGTTPTLDVKLQVKDPVSKEYVDLTGAAFAQKSDVGTALLIVYPGIAETTNAAVSLPLPADWRAVAALGGTTPSFTFSLGGYYLP